MSDGGKEESTQQQGGDVAVATAATAAPLAIPVATVVPRRLPHRGFSTSICELFHGSHPLHREDCCAFACCGILAYDKNKYLMAQKKGTYQESTILRMVTVLFVVPCLFLFCIMVAADMIPDADLSEQVSSTFMFLLCLYIVGISVKYRLDRVKFRREVSEMAGTNYSVVSAYSPAGAVAGGAAANVNPYRSHAHAASQPSDDCCAYGMCSLYPVDRDAPSLPPDFCTKTMQCFANSCCGTLCNCWCQCCGCCATAQESREMALLLGSNPVHIDYVTYQPFQEYMGKLSALREEQNGSLVKHYQAVSRLSVLLLKALGMVGLAMLLVGLFDMRNGGSFQLWNLVIMMATFSQAFIILYVVHWKWNRFDLSLDAIMKFFASGFLLTTGLALFFEMVLSTGFQLIMGFLVVTLEGDKLAEQMDQQENNNNDDQSRSASDILSSDYPALILVFLACNAYCVAALCEEMCKYFGYWMMQHAEFMSQYGGIRTKQSLGMAVTLAMVAVALGFACCENLIYIFVYTDGGVQMEFATLMMRSLFPVHPLCAAIQSIDVVRRDMEGHSTLGIGKIMAPAVLLHGTFDYVLMVLGYLNPVGEADENNEDMSSPEAMYLTLLSFGISFLLVGMGLCYYTKHSRAQTRRLQSMDANGDTVADAGTDPSSRLV